MNYSNSSRKHFLLFSCFVVFLLFFRARWAFTISYVDETCYLESLHKLLGLNYPACYLTTHLPGVVLSWVPVAGLAALLSQISSYGFEDWLMPLLGLFSFGCWGLTLFQIDKLIQVRSPRNIATSNYSGMTALLFLLNVPALDFATRLTTMAHATELLVAFLILVFIQEKKFSMALVFSLWLSLIRLNDLLIVLLVLGAILDDKGFSFETPRSRKLATLGILVCLVIAAVGIWLGMIHGHANMKISTIAQSISKDSLLQVILSPVESIFLYLPLWTVTLILGFIHFRKLSWTSRAGIVWMLAVFFFNAGHRGHWKTDGPHFRFFIGSYVAVLQILLELGPSFSRSIQKVIKAALIFGCLWYTLFVWTGADAYNWTRLYTFEGGLSSSYTAYDGSETPAYLRKFVLEPVGLSPIFFSAFSFFKDKELFLQFSHLKKYAIQGCSLAVLISVTLFSCFFCFYQFLKSTDIINRCWGSKKSSYDKSGL